MFIPIEEIVTPSPTCLAFTPPEVAVAPSPIKELAVHIVKYDPADL
jgi:hypothetical protein